MVSIYRLRGYSMKLTLLALTLLAAELSSSPAAHSCVDSDSEHWINCVSYSPPFHDLSCNWGGLLSIDFLYWYARETPLSYCLNIETVNAGTEGTPLPNYLYGESEAKSLDTKWAPGFRLQLGGNFDCSKWDTLLSWTWYFNSRQDTTTTPNYSLGGNIFFPSLGEHALVNPWTNQSFGSFTFDRVSAKWKLRLNDLLWQWGYKYHLSSCFVIRPYTALRGALIKTVFQTESNRNTPVPTTTQFQSIQLKDKYKNQFWGVGLSGGLQPQFYLSEGTLIYADMSSSLLWGQETAKKRESYFEQKQETNSPPETATFGDEQTSSFANMQGTLDLGLGIRWEEKWGSDRYLSSLDLGWEHHIWLDFASRVTTLGHFRDSVTAGYFSYDTNAGNLQFGGFVLRLALEF